MDRNPATDATLPKRKREKREIWTAETLMKALEVCDNKQLKVVLHLTFAATLRMGELLGLTWDCVDISEEAIEENRCYIYLCEQGSRTCVKGSYGGIESEGYYPCVPNTETEQ